MAIDALIARMTRDAQEHIAALQAAADAEVVALAGASARAVSSALEKDMAAHRAARESAFAAERAVAQRRAAAAVLAAQHALLDRVFARAEALAAGSDADRRHLEALPRQVATVLRYLGGRPATLRCTPPLRPYLEPLLAQAPQVEVLADDAQPAGFTASTRDGSCSIDCSRSAQLAALRPQLEAALLAQVPA